ncbi:MAG: tRNA (adenosine(37)-N6)-dimethylallyltransferase MiaA [Gammaproteobacteria bacterium]
MVSPARVLCIMGPTGVGKTDLALEIAQSLPCQIISVDSAMIYRGMSIGTAKPDAKTLAQVPHHLIDICDPTERYSAVQFCQAATNHIKNIIASGDTPLLVGGTMLYFQALQKGLSPVPPSNAEIRAQLSADAQVHGWEALHRRLSQIDPQAGARIHPNDPQRIQRALEVYLIGGKTLSQYWESTQKVPLAYDIVNIVLIPQDRAVLHQRIEQRLQSMFAIGFIDEVEQLYRQGDLNLTCPSIRTVGYRQIWQYLMGECSKQEMSDKAMYATRQLAKRQLTWLRKWQRHYADLHMIDPFSKNLLARTMTLL